MSFLKQIITLTTLASFTLLPNSRAEAQYGLFRDSTFQKSCRDINFVALPGTLITINAQCRDQSGRYIPTVLLLKGYQNFNGTVVYAPGLSSTLHYSCPSIYFPGASPYAPPFFTAICRTASGQLWTNAYIKIYDVHNINGFLTQSAY